LETACSSPAGDLLVVVTALKEPSATALTAITVDAKGTPVERKLPALDGSRRFSTVEDCLATGDGYLLIGNVADKALSALWLGLDLEPLASLALFERPVPPRAWGLAVAGNGRFVVVADNSYVPVILIFDRETVVNVEPPWPADQARVLYDVVSIGDRVTVCGIERENLEEPVFESTEVVVGSFGLDGVPHGTIHVPGFTCRLFPDPQGGLALLHQSSPDPRSGLRVTRLDRDLRELGSRSPVDQIAFLFKLEAARVDDSFVVLYPHFISPALDVVGQAAHRRIPLDLGQDRPAALRSAGQRIYVLSQTSRPDAPDMGLRVDAFELRPDP
jgi:hypothetical protein